MMKKIMTTTLLVAAGTAFSAAASIVAPGIDDTWTTAASGGSINSSNKTLTNLTFTSADWTQIPESGDYSWCVSFKLSTVSKLDSTLAKNRFFSTERRKPGENFDSAAGWYIQAMSKESDTVKLAIGGNDSEPTGQSQTVSVKFGTSADLVSFIWNAENSTLSLVCGDSTVIKTFKASDTNKPSPLNKATASFWTNGANIGSIQSSDIAVYVKAVPEPSAFGLLAGLGALALVASRRRRSRK